MLNQIGDELPGIVPSPPAQAAAAVHEDCEIDLGVAGQVVILVQRGARVSVAVHELQSGLVGGVGAGAGAGGRGDDALLSALGAAPAGLGAGSPVAPVRQDAVGIAGVGVAALGLLGVFTGLAVVLHLGHDGSHALANAATALGRAAGPALPLADDAVDGAGLHVAALLFGQRRAGHAVHRVHQDRPCLRQEAASASGRALARLEVGHLAIGDENTLTFHLVELSSNLLEGAHLGLEVVLLVAALLHLLDVLGFEVLMLVRDRVGRRFGGHLILGSGRQLGLGVALLVGQVRDLILLLDADLVALVDQGLQVALELGKHVLDARLDVQEPVADLSAATLAQGALVGGNALSRSSLVRNLRDVQVRGVAGRCEILGIGRVLLILGVLARAGGASKVGAASGHEGGHVAHALLGELFGLLVLGVLGVELVEVGLQVTLRSSGLELVDQRLEDVALDHDVASPGLFAVPALHQGTLGCCVAVADDLQDGSGDVQVGSHDVDLGHQGRLVGGALGLVLRQGLLDLGDLQLREGDDALGLEDDASGFGGRRVIGGNVHAHLVQIVQRLSVVGAACLDLVVQLSLSVVHHRVEHVASPTQRTIAFWLVLAVNNMAVVVAMVVL
mmetsp:Transcript_36327/g.78623  ORF Transcript_36327/g.78623 Transcript_36327/m.78623 type:complete len:617 (+) Transcript_36327:820-2670(+)